MNLLISTATKTDTKSIACLVNAAYRPDGYRTGWTHKWKLIVGERITEEQINSLFVENSLIFIALEKNVIVACEHIKIENTFAHIGMLATNPARQTKGYGKLMFYMLKVMLATFFIHKFEMVVFRESGAYFRLFTTWLPSNWKSS